MENDVAEHFHWSINQEANFWFEDQNGQTSLLATDQQLIALLRASKLLKFIMTIDRCEHGQNMTQMEDQSLVINDDVQFEGNEHQLVVSNAEDLVQVSSRGVIAEYQGKEWADEPELGITVAGPDRIEEEEEEHYIARGFDPEGDDPIGADEEWRYFKKQQNAPEGGSNEKVQQEKNKGKVYEGTDPDVVQVMKPL